MDKKNNQISSTIAFNSEDDKQHCYETNGANITVQVQPRLNSSSHGSSMVKLKKLFGFKWETKNYPGRLIAVHKDGKILAYSICVNTQGMVRIIHLGMGNKRLLIKGTGECLDMEFAHCSRQIIIGFIDESSVQLCKIEANEAADELTYVFLLKIENPLFNHVPIMDKIRFCPFVPEENDIEDEFSVLLFVWVRGNKFECYSAKTILDTYGEKCEKTADELSEGIVKSYEDDRAIITSVTFSPDGTTLAIGTQDGSIRFYQIYFHETTPRCLHTWNPHESQAISDFFFLDNHTQPIAGSALWKYVVTLANNNTEIKVSSCDSWKVLQTIQFKSANGQPLSFKAEIDRTSSYLILSDMNNRQLYILQILKENQLSQNNGDDHNNGSEASGSSGSGGIARVFVKSIAEFHLSSKILSYDISNASIRRYKCALSENYLIDELEDYDEENSSIFCVALKLYAIFPDSVQECQILYQTPLNQSAEVLKTEVTTSTEPKSPAPSALPLLNVSCTGVEIKKNDLALRTPPQKASQLNLLTPDSFSSPVEKPKEVSQEVLSTIFMLAKNNQASTVTNKSHENVLKLPNCALIEEEKILQQKIAAEVPPPPTQLPLKSASGGSSPSREVRDIMLQADSNNEEYYPPDEDDDIDIDEPEDKAVLNALNALGVTHFKNIDDDDDDDDDEDDGNEEDDEDDEPDVKVTTAKKPDWPQAPQFIDSSTAATSKQVETLSNRMNQMIEIMEQQSRYIAELRNDIYSLKSQTNAEAVMAQNALTRVEESGKKAVDQNYSKVETLLLNREKHNQRELTESIMKLFQQLSRNQLATTESAVKESVKSICGNKAFVDGISQAMLSGTQKSLEQIFRKSLEDIMIPSYEKITHEMFQEMGKVFTQGTKDYTQAFDAYIKQYGAVHYQMTQFGDTIRQIPQQVKQEVKSTYDANVIPVLNSKLSHLKQQLDVFQAKITQDIRELVRKEIQNGFEQQKSSLEDSVLSVVTRSQAETPAPPTAFDHQQSIKQYLAMGEINKAFHEALISNDLSLVEFTIEKADFNSVFKSPGQLEQTVLLSLIQQITVDMNRYSEIKNRYLNEAIINLNMADPITREHSPKILRELYNTLQIYVASNPTSQLTTSIKMIMLAAQSIANM